MRVFCGAASNYIMHSITGFLVRKVHSPSPREFLVYSTLGVPLFGVHRMLAVSPTPTRMLVPHAGAPRAKASISTPIHAALDVAGFLKMHNQGVVLFVILFYIC